MRQDGRDENTLAAYSVEQVRLDANLDVARAVIDLLTAYLAYRVVVETRKRS